jgi:hypothetical protein
VAACLAGTITNPLDMAKLRLQVQRAGNDTKSFQYNHMFDAMYKIARAEGPTALFNGALARIFYQVPAIAISMTVMEQCKPRILAHL